MKLEIESLCAANNWTSCPLDSQQEFLLYDYVFAAGLLVVVRGVAKLSFRLVVQQHRRGPDLDETATAYTTLTAS